MPDFENPASAEAATADTAAPVLQRKDLRPVFGLGLLPGLETDLKTLILCSFPVDLGAVVTFDIKISDMAADGARKTEIHASRSAGIVEAAVMRYIRVDQFDHLGAVAGFFILTEYVNPVPELDKNTGRAPLGTHCLVISEYGP